MGKNGQDIVNYQAVNNIGWAHLSFIFCRIYGDTNQTKVYTYNCSIYNFHLNFPLAKCGNQEEGQVHVNVLIVSSWADLLLEQYQSKYYTVHSIIKRYFPTIIYFKTKFI